MPANYPTEKYAAQLPVTARRSSAGEPNPPDSRQRAGGWVGGAMPRRSAGSQDGHPALLDTSALDERGLAAWNAHSKGVQERCSCPKVAGARSESPRRAQRP